MPERDHLPEAYDIHSPEDAKRLYGDWAKSYDAELEARNAYSGPREAAAVLARHVTDKTARIIDIGCGTGLVGRYLAGHGLTTVDGLDLVPEMLTEAGKKGVYGRLIEADLLQGAPLADDAYDAAISVGTFTHNHVGPSGLDEVLRLVKPRGLVVVMINVEAFEADGYAAKFAALEQAHMCRVIATEDGILFGKTGLKGRILVLEVR